MTAHRLRELLYLKFRNPPFVLQVVLVSDDDDVLHRVLTVIVVGINPLIEVVKALLARDVEHKYAAVCSPVVACREGAESFLACRVPDLKPHFLGIAAFSVLESPRATVHTNGGIITFQLLAFSYPHKEGCFAGELVSNYDHLEALIVGTFEGKYVF